MEMNLSKDQISIKSKSALRHFSPIKEKKELQTSVLHKVPKSTYQAKIEIDDILNTPKDSKKVISQ